MNPYLSITVPDLGGRPPCADADPELFFLEPGGSGLREAKAICARCTVQPACLLDALNNGERWGIWGGLTPEERHKLARGRAS